MTTEHAGSCLCGAVRYTVTGVFERFYLCHCTHCRKDTGTTHAANLFSASARLAWLSGQDAVTTFQLPGTRHVRSFCATCGSALPHAGAHGTVVPAGSLDSELVQVPDGHIFTGSRARWTRDLGGVPEFVAFPEIADAS